MRIKMLNTNRLIAQYEKIYGKTVDISSWNEETANKVLEWCDQKKQKILVESHFNSYLNNKSYTRILILEALARQVLREIAPKRIRKRGLNKNG